MPMRLKCLRDRNSRMSSDKGSYRESGLRDGVMGWVLGGLLCALLEFSTPAFLSQLFLNSLLPSVGSSIIALAVCT